MFRLILTLIGVVTLCGSARCETVPAEPASTRPGVVFVVCGVGGFDVVGAAAQRALPQVGIPHEVRDFAWTHGWGRIFKDLKDTQHLVRKAEELAEEVRKVKEKDPQCPVYLIGKSGGTGLVIATAEQLPEATLERIILLSSALSPTYDLRSALRATRKEIVSFNSVYDQVILGWGTWQFGTVDRVYGVSAGVHGFKVPENLPEEDRKLYQRLVQVPWHGGMFWQGHPGLHYGTSLPAFLTREVVPWLKP